MGAGSPWPVLMLSRTPRKWCGRRFSAATCQQGSARCRYRRGRSVLYRGRPSDAAGAGRV